MAKALESNGSRVLTPEEAGQIRAVIEKPSLMALWDLLLYTGLRLAEVKQLRDNPDIFDQERRTITIKSGKVKAKQFKRNVCLSDKGLAAVRAYLENPTVPASPTAWQLNLIRWATRARLAAIPEQDKTSPSNPTGITARTTRKSWESWLLTAYPDEIVRITLSQGHTESTALRHYMNLSFTQEEREAIRAEVTGWGPC
jgi:integrase